MIKGFYVQGDVYEVVNGEIIAMNGFSCASVDSDYELSEEDCEWDEDEFDWEDSDWDYNEDEGFDPYEGCYTWDC